VASWNAILADPDSLLGRLQRGRGDAVREMFALPRAIAGDALIQCLCTNEDLGQHREAYAELVLALAPDLSAWFRWIEALRVEAPEDLRSCAFNTLGEVARRGQGEATSFLRSYVVDGIHWRNALDQFLVDGIELDDAVWAKLVSRLNDDELDLLLTVSLDSPRWSRLAIEDERVRRLLHERLDRRDQDRARFAWSEANYGNAPASRFRWKVLASLLEQAPDAARPLLIDGLWDGSPWFRERCMALCDPSWPGVRERLIELAGMTGSQSAMAARRWLERQGHA
jgi:hypothetical protein